MRQRNLSDYFPPSSDHSEMKSKGNGRRRSFSVSGDEPEDMPQHIQFETVKANYKEQVTSSDDDQEESLQSPQPTLRSKRASRRTIRSPGNSPLLEPEPDSEDEDTQPRVTSTRGIRRKLIIESDEEKDSPRPNKRRRISRRCNRSESPEDLLQELDADKIIEARLRNPRESAYSRNLAKLKRRKERLPASSVSEEEAECSDSPDRVPFLPFEGARPDTQAVESDEDESQDRLKNEPEDDFIVEDDPSSAFDMPELPSAFSMQSHQDLSHHFKIVCQLFVHLLCHNPDERGRRMGLHMKNQYFSTAITQVRRKVSALKDSLVTSSVWKPSFKAALESFPIFDVFPMDFSVPICDACQLGGRISTICGRLSGREYENDSFEDIEPSDEPEIEDTETKHEFSLGRFCARRAKIFHEYTHWEYALFTSLLVEIRSLTAANEDGFDGPGRRFVRVAWAGDAHAPENTDNPDEVMEWLDQRGVINREWMKMKALMQSAHNLEMIKEKEDTAG